MISPILDNRVLGSSPGLHVGHTVLAQFLSASISGIDIVDRTKNLPEDGPYPLWLRDWQVFNPFTGANNRVEKLPETRCSLGYYVRELFPSLQAVSIIDKAAQKLLPDSLQDENPYIEGGNVLFWSHSGKQGAIIGLTSALWTLEKLKNGGYFFSKIDGEIACMRSEGLPEQERDLDTAKWRLTLKVIAKKLQVSLDNLIVLEHNLEARGTRLCLHIDLTVLLGPQNKVFLHKSSLCKEQYDLASGLKNDSIRKPYLVPVDDAITERNQKRLEAQGFEVIFVGGYYEFTDGAIYFLNGLLFEEKNRHFFLTGAGCHAGKEEGTPFKPSSEYVDVLSHRFSQTMGAHGIDVVYVDLRKPSLGGGVHCLTTDVRSPSLLPPQAIPIARMASRISTLFALRVKGQAEVTCQFVRLQLDDQAYQRKRCIVQEGKPLVIELQVPIGGSVATVWTDRKKYPPLKLLPGHPSQLFLDRNDEESPLTA